MKELLKMMDEQMLAWVAELDDLYKRKATAGKAIHELEQRIDIARQAIELFKGVVK